MACESTPDLMAPAIGAVGGTNPLGHDLLAE